MSALTRRSLLAAVPALGIGALAACGTDSASSSGGSDSGTGAASSAAGTWPREYKDAMGHTVTIKAQPQNIASTSVVLTGDLLAINAPLTGSGATKPNVVGVDDKGFFTQWSKVAAERGVKVLYDNAELDLEAVQAAAPDLIIISSIGGDSTADQYDQLQQIAPTIALDYNSTAWEDIMKELGTITGHEADAAQALKDFSAKIAEIRSAITPPTEDVQAVVYQGETGMAFALPDGPHADMLKELGFTVAPLPEGAQAEKGRGDVAFTSTEVAVAGLTAKNVLLIDGDDETVKAVKADKLYADVPCMGKDGRLVPLGHPCFKLDYYSALDMAEHIKSAYAK